MGKYLNTYEVELDETIKVYFFMVVFLAACGPIREIMGVKQSPIGITLIGAEASWRNILATSDLIAKATEHCISYNKETILIETADDEFTKKYKC